MYGVTTGVMNSDFHKWTTGLPKEQTQQQIGFGKILQSGYNLTREAGFSGNDLLPKRRG